MSISKQTDPNSQNIRMMWNSLSPYLIPPFSASIAIIPVYFGLMSKTAKQLGAPLPIFNKQVIINSFKAAPTAGAIVGTQMITINLLEKRIEKESSNFKSIALSTIITGLASVPPYIIFQGQTMGKSALEIMKFYKFNINSLKQTGAIMARETSFLLAIRISDLTGNLMQKLYGKNRAVEFGSTFASGFIASVLGHPADTILARLISGMQTKTLSQSMQGVMLRALSIGGFTVCYKVLKNNLEKI